MALFTDTAVITLTDLLSFEGSLAQVVSSHDINVDAKIGLAMSSIGDKLMLWLLNAGGLDPQWPNRRRLGLSTVLVTPALQRWICLDSLSRIFAEAYNSQLNTRYEQKWKEYQQEAAKGANLVLVGGVGIVFNPLPRPDMPLISVQNGNLPAQGIFVRTCWVDAYGNESALSLENATVLPGDSGIAVAMAEGALGAPVSAVGWNVYGGGESTPVTKQNFKALAIGSTWQLPASGLQIGSTSTGGQNATLYVSFANRISRG